jgi:predicted nucleic-acid-binding Zn-ribbon protein
MFKTLFGEAKMQQRICPKCHHGVAQVREAYVSGGFASRILNMSASGYNVFICNQCGFSEFFAQDVGPGNAAGKKGRLWENILDFIFG